jgi:hypothetical protein
MKQYLRIGFAAMLCMLLLVSTVAGEVSSEISTVAEDENLEEFILNIPAISNKTLDNLKENSNILKVQGEIPELESGKEVYEWTNQVDKIRVNIREDKSLDNYYYPSGPLLAYGTDAKGYFVVMLYDKAEIKDEDIDSIAEIITKYATKSSIKNVPIVFTTDELIRPVSSSVSATSAAAIRTNPYLIRYRPITAGIAHSVYFPLLGQAQLGTIGFTAKRTSDNTLGYVIAGHVAGWQTGLSSYQPIYNATNYNAAVSVLGANTDAAFVPYSNVVDDLHIGGGTFVDVYGTYSGGISGMQLTKSSTVSGSVTGTYLAVLTGQNVLGHFMDKIEVMSTGCQGGDSGGPVYYTSSGRYRIVGIISANGTYNGAPATIYIPYGEVASKLGVEALK